MLVTSSFKNKSFVYDFAVDGGAIGSIPMGVIIAAGSLLVPQMCSIYVQTTFTSGAGATYEIGILGSTQFYTLPIVAAALPPAPAQTAIPNALFAITTNLEVLFTIAVNPITAGKATFVFYYQEF